MYFRMTAYSTSHRSSSFFVNWDIGTFYLRPSEHEIPMCSYKFGSFWLKVKYLAVGFNAGEILMSRAFPRCIFIKDRIDLRDRSLDAERGCACTTYNKHTPVYTFLGCFPRSWPIYIIDLRSTMVSHLFEVLERPGCRRHGFHSPCLLGPVPFGHEGNGAVS